MLKVGMPLLLLVLVILPMGEAVCQPTVIGQPGYSVATAYSEPAVLGKSMFVIINVTNLAYYIEATVESVELTFDWDTAIAGATPISLEPGANYTFRFDSVDIPYATWEGNHACLISVTVIFSYPYWQQGRYGPVLKFLPLDAQGEMLLQFAVQPQPNYHPQEARTGPSLIKEMPNATSLGEQSIASSFSLLYRASMTVAVVFILLMVLPHSPNPIRRIGQAEQKTARSGSNSSVRNEA